MCEFQCTEPIDMVHGPTVCAKCTDTLLLSHVTGSVCQTLGWSMQESAANKAKTDAPVDAP